MTEEEIQQKIKTIFTRVFPELQGAALDMNKPQSAFENWDSFAHMELVGMVESECGVAFTPDEVIRIDSPQAFLALVLKKKNG